MIILPVSDSLWPRLSHDIQHLCQSQLVQDILPGISHKFDIVREINNPSPELLIRDNCFPSEEIMER